MITTFRVLVAAGHIKQAFALLMTTARHADWFRLSELGPPWFLAEHSHTLLGLVHRFNEEDRAEQYMILRSAAIECGRLEFARAVAKAMKEPLDQNELLRILGNTNLPGVPREVVRIVPGKLKNTALQKALEARFHRALREGDEELAHVLAEERFNRKLTRSETEELIEGMERLGRVPQLLKHLEARSSPDWTSLRLAAEGALIHGGFDDFELALEKLGRRPTSEEVLTYLLSDPAKRGRKPDEIIRAQHKHFELLRLEDDELRRAKKKQRS